MTITADYEMTDAELDAPLAFPLEHYGCPAWCTVNASPTGAHHDSADGMPGNPEFAGYWHWTGLYVPCQWGPDDQVSIHLGQKSSVPVIAVMHTDEAWAEFTVDEAEQLAAEITRMVAAYGPPKCPAWCDSDHRSPVDEHDHYGASGILRTAAPGHYGVDLSQREPEITLYDGIHGMQSEVITLTLREARQVAGAITELVTAARENRAVREQ